MRRFDILYPILYEAALLLAIVAAGAIAGLFFGSILSNFLGGGLMTYVLLFVGAAVLLRGGAFLVTHLSKTRLSAEAAWLQETEQAQSCKVLQLEEKRVQLEAKRVEAQALEAKANEQLAAANAELATQEKQRKQLAIDRRRFEAFKREMKTEAKNRKASIAEIKAQHGGVFPPEEWDRVLDDSFTQLEAIDPPLFQNMFFNPFSFIEIPKPLKQPDNPIHHLLEQAVEKGALDPAALEDEEVICSITRQVMQDPIKGEDGRVYDRFCLENIYYAYPGTYPFDRRKMTVDPADLPRDQACYRKIQQLIKQAQPQQIPPEESAQERSASLLCQ